jgi:hypothetical protein
MPAIASLEDLKAAQKEGLDIYAMCYTSLQSRTRDTDHRHGFDEERTPEQLKGKGSQ